MTTKLDEINAFLSGHPEIRSINQGFLRNEGLLKSLEHDSIALRDGQGKL